MALGRLPDFIIIGAAKCGTTSLHKYLSMHPEVSVGDTEEVYFADPKEPEFFAVDSVYEKGLDYYSKLFSSARKDQICGEASTIYTLYPSFPHVASRISAAIPDVKLIYIMRNPVDRAYSFYVQIIHNFQDATKNYSISRTFEECIFPGKYPNRAKRDTFYAPFDEHLKDEPGTFLDGGKYYTQISEYFKYFDRSQMLFLLFDEFIHYPELVLKNVCEFLAIDSTFNFTEKDKVAMNITNDYFKNIKRILTIKSLKRIPFVHKVGRVIPDKFKMKLINIFMNNDILKSNDIWLPKEMLPETRMYLADFYSVEINKLENLLELDFSHWKRKMNIIL
ncbi:sulfotransferase domain-containing protein [Thermodesulfobacteriota bacterium]